jgi:hypothetical protein
VLPDWRAADLPMHVVYAAQRLLPVRVRAFVLLSLNFAQFREEFHAAILVSCSTSA